MKRKFQLCSRCYLCEEQAETVNHLFLHCKWTDQLWRIFSSLRKITWVKPRNIVQLLNCWINIGTTTIKEERWRIVPACIWWTVWKERDQRCFEGKKNNLQNFKMNCIALYYFWCKQKVLVQTEEFFDVLDFVTKSTDGVSLVCNTFGGGLL
ncbi:hypothetical protein MTR67_019050 [Solanum verrucosum]|uniref:Reverse transcriptase zinc-binding domain-containing protein n=1 Tax=Solanum verrucosum TaxID=315347 RepID=A0AAF0QR19_SOLVR|nr:hypothetical protein MTR67_019050 [Solanum verrucosum]